MDGERHGVAVAVRGKRDRRSAAVLYRVANQIRYELGQPVGVSFALQVSVGLQPHDCLRLTGSNRSDSISDVQLVSCECGRTDRSPKLCETSKCLRITYAARSAVGACR